MREGLPKYSSICAYSVIWVGCELDDGSVIILVQPRIRFKVREKRTDAKNALKNILLNGGLSQVSVTISFEFFLLLPDS